MTKDMRKIQELLVQHLGPIKSVKDEDGLIRIIIDVAYPNGKNIHKALTDAGFKVTPRQVGPYKDALILGRIKGWTGQELFDYIKKETVFNLGVKVMLL